MPIAIIILAAGNSSRLGNASKQLLHYDGQTLIRRVTEIALSLEKGPVIVVLGANQEKIQPEIADLSVHIAYNHDWQEGIASSLRSGLSVFQHEAIDAFLILLTDQPYVSTDLLRQLIDTYQQTGKGIVACQYGEANHAGVPALFNRKYIPEFMKLSGDVGARKLIQQHASDCTYVAFPLATIDLDTQEDVAKWLG